MALPDVPAHETVTDPELPAAIVSEEGLRFRFAFGPVTDIGMFGSCNAPVTLSVPVTKNV